MAEANGTTTESVWSLKGMIALVTGGTRGIGHAIVEELCGLGAIVHTCSRNETELHQILGEWKQKGFTVSGSVNDLSSPTGREELMETVSSLYGGKLNILINNVGMNIRKPTVDYSFQEFTTIMSTNFDSTFHLCQLVHPLLKSSGSGSIVFISSVCGLVSVNAGSIYGASKGAINQLTKQLACEWAKDGIRSNCVSPWYTKTSMVDKLLEDQDFIDRVAARTPLRRLADSKEISPIVAFLCMPKAASYITGQIISADGGMSVNGFWPTQD
ncbi:tropinone reductase I [Ranunculus cassubicifolius]